MMSTLNRLQMRLFAAMLGFYALALTLGADPWLNYMAACAFAALLAIPIRFCVAVVEIVDSLTDGKLLGTQP